MLTVLDLAQEDIQFNRKASTRREKKGPCPGCGGTDRFSIRQDDTGRWVFMCRGCWDPQEYTPVKERKRGWGDAIDYLRHFRKMSYQQARTFVDEAEPDQGYKTPIPFRVRNWQEVIASSVKECEARLWSPKDTTAYVVAKGYNCIRLPLWAWSL
jgi:hypothetical protein